MKIIHTYPIAFLFSVIVPLILPKSSFSQDISALLSKADTTGFSVKHSEWGLLNFYQAMDSSKATVTLEIIAANTSKKTDWTAEQYLGRIKDAKFQPKRVQEIEYKLLQDSYTIRIEKSGKCYFYLTKGNPLSGDVLVFPLFVQYQID